MRRRYPGGWVMIPAAPCTSGSRGKAALPSWGWGEDPGRALHERHEDESGDRLVAAGDDRLRRERRRLEAMPGAGGPAIHVRRRHAQDVEEQGVEDLMEEVHSADAHRAEGVAVVRLAEGDELRFL